MDRMQKILNMPILATGILGLIVLPAVSWSSDAVDLEEMFEERIRSVVAVEYFAEIELDRRPASELGLVADGEGLIVLPDHAVPDWIPVDKLKDFKVLPLRSQDKFEAEYLGQDALTGWHYLRVEDEELRSRLVPVTAYETERPRVGREVWGIAVLDEDFDYDPYFVSSRFSNLRELPQKMGLTVSEVASPGSLVFTFDGALIGWAGTSYAREMMLHMGDDRRVPIALQGMRESGTFLPVDEFLPYLDRVPSSPHERVKPWLGLGSLQAVEREVAKLLDIRDRGAIILSEIIEGNPAYEAGFENGDIVIAIDGEPIPYFRPLRAAQQHLQREILKREPGDKLRLTFIRGTEEMELEATLGTQPKSLRDARREYFSGMGLTVREFLVFDGIARRTAPEEEQGLIVQFVRPNGPAQSAGLETGDWIKEVDGVEVTTYSEAVELVAEAEESDRREAVFLISRNNETSVVRVRLR